MKFRNHFSLRSFARPLCLTLAVLLGAISTAVAEQKLYTCSMHPQIIRTEPGSCPICGMDLTPVVGGAAASGAALSAIHVDTRTVQMMNLRTEVLESAAAQRDLRALGVVAFDETSLADITTRYEGWIEKLYANKPWQRVKKGDPLFEIYSPALYNAQLNYLVALRSEGEKGGTLTAASRERLLLLGVSDAFIADLARRGEAERNYTYPAAQDGIVVEKMVVQGQKIMAGDAIYRLADISKVWVEVQVFEKDLPLVKAGQQVRVRAASGSDVLIGVVTEVLPRVLDATRSGTARIELENPQEKLFPGMFAEASIAIALSDAALLVPDEAVLRSGAGNIVFIAQEDGSFVPREVELGARTDDHRYIVRSGLSEGDKVVVSGQFMLDSESRLREAIRKMTEAATGKAASATGDTVAPAAGHEHCANSETDTAHKHCTTSVAECDHSHGTHASAVAGKNGHEDCDQHQAGAHSAKAGAPAVVVNPAKVVAAARGNIGGCASCASHGHIAAGAGSHSAHHPTASQVAVASDAMESSTAENSSDPATVRAALKALGLAAADSASALAADDVVGHAETLSKLNAALLAYADAAGTEADSVLAGYAKRNGLRPYSTLAQAREDFTPFSNALSAQIRNAGLNREGDLHVFQCPMVPKVGTGSWLQRGSDKVANPFFGASMLTCGDIVR